MTTVTKKGGVRHYTGSLANCRLLPQRVLAFVTDTLKELFINVAGVDYHFYPNIGGARHIESFRVSGYTDTQTLTAAASSGTSVWFPSGTWTSTSALTFASGTKFLGSGTSSVLTFANNIRNAILLDAVMNCQLKDLRILASSSGLSDYSSGVVTFTNGPQNISIENCYFESNKVTDLFFSGVNATASRNVMVRNCHFTHADKSTGIQFVCFMTGRSLTRRWFTADGVTDTFATNFTMASTSELSVYVAGKLQVAGSDYTVSLAAGIATVVFTTPPVNNPDSGYIVSLVLNSGPMFQKIDQVGHTQVTFSECSFNQCGNGFLIDGDAFELRNSTFNTTDTPVAVSFAEHLMIQNNRCYEFSGNGMVIGNGSDDIIHHYTISGNTLSSSRSTLHGINVYKAGGNPQGFGGPNYGQTKYGVISGNNVQAALASIFLYGNGDCSVTGNYCVGGLSGVGGIGIMVNTHDKDGGAVHPGKIVISGNVTRSGTGVTIGASGIAGVSDITVTNNDIGSVLGGDTGGYGIQLSRASNIKISSNNIRNIRTYDPVAYDGAGIGINQCGDGIVLDGNRVIGGVNHASVWYQSSATALAIFRNNEWNGVYKKLGGGADPISWNNLNTSTLKHFGSNSTALTGASSAGSAATYSASTTWTGGQTGSENRSGLVLVTFGSARAASANYATDHAHAVAIVLLGRSASGTWTVVSTTYLLQHNGATISVVADGDVLTFTGTSGATSATRSIITVQPYTSPLVNDANGEAL